MSCITRQITCIRKVTDKRRKQKSQQAYEDYDMFSQAYQMTQCIIIIILFYGMIQQIHISIQTNLNVILNVW